MTDRQMQGQTDHAGPGGGWWDAIFCCTMLTRISVYCCIIATILGSLLSDVCGGCDWAAPGGRRPWPGAGAALGAVRGVRAWVALAAAPRSRERRALWWSSSPPPSLQARHHSWLNFSQPSTTHSHTLSTTPTLTEMTKGTTWKICKL